MRLSTRISIFAGMGGLLGTASFDAFAAPAAPSGPHPRIFLTKATTDAMKAKVTDSSSAVAAVIANCATFASKPAREVNGDDFSWSFGAVSCALAWQLTGDANAASTGLTLFNALLDDYNTIGDGAGGDTAVTHDAGYDIRVFGPYAALVYDWMHDAPGVDATLRAHAQARFKAWLDWYATDGYLNDTPGANYHAGYVFAKTLISIAAAGEDGTTSAAYWADVNDKLFAAQIVKVGLAKGGALVGGDWPEGWQYGPLSVMEYSLSARALEEQGSPQPEVRQWASDLTLAYLFAVSPKQDGLFTDGDLDNSDPLANPVQTRPFLATMAGPGSTMAAGYAASLRAKMGGGFDDCPVFDALADARGVTPLDYTSTSPPLWYLAPGTRTLFARSSWTSDATWTYFTSAPRLVPDHQHVDASNFVLARGDDFIISDPSPYGSLSTLTGNGLTVDSNVIDPKAKPGQSIWESTADEPWARAATSGIAAARAELSGAFTGVHNVASDVPFARRDFAYFPEGDVVVIDRARTDDAARGLHLRFRTQAKLTLSASAPFTASGIVGASQAVIHATKLSSGTPKVRSVAGAQSGCDNAPTWGVCDAARFDVDEYSVDVAGPLMLAVHVIDGLGSSDAMPTAVDLADPTIDTTPPENTGVVGAALVRGGAASYVVASSGKDGAVTGGTLTYGVPGSGASRHVVFDAPEDGSGASSVATKVSNGRCVVSITAGGSGAFAGHPLIFTLASASSGCSVNEDKGAPPAGVDPGSGSPSGAPGAGPDGGAGNADNGGDGSGGCGCEAAGVGNVAWKSSAMGMAIAAGALATRRRRRRRDTAPTAC